MATAKHFQLSESWQQRIRSALMVVLLVWLAWVLANTFWLFMSGPAEPVVLDRNMAILQAPAESDSATSMQRSDEHIRSWELFGPLAVAQERVAEAPETRLRLELLGVFENVEAGLGSAIIAEQGKDGDLYHPGDKVPGNATLEEIYADRVILLRMGQREALRIKEVELSGEVAQVSAPSSRRTVGDSQGRASSPSDEGDDGDLVEQRNMIISRLGLTSADSGGYVIGSNAPAQVLQVIGLRSGDVLVSVNGHDVGNEEADIAALQEFRSTGAASIVVQRGAQRFTVNYPP
jgi:general secretion pathway protein C